MSRTDAELVTAFRGGEEGAFAELYDRYSDRIHTFAFTRLRDASAAERALQTTFFEVPFRIDEVGDGEGFRPWLFGVAGRVIAVESRRSGERTDRVDDEPRPDDSRGDDAQDDGRPAADPDDTASLVWAATAGLRSHDQELLEIHLREGLDRDEISQISGVPPEHVDVMIARLKRRLEIAVGSLLAARAGSDDCPGLDAIIQDWDGRFSVAFRSEATRHIESCDVCRDTHRAQLDWDTIAAALPVCPAPQSARTAVLAAMDEPSDALLAVAVPPVDEVPDEPTDPPRAVRSSPGVALVAVATVALVVLVVGLIGGGDEGSNDTNTAGSTYPTSPPSTAPPSTAPSTSTTVASTTTTSTTTATTTTTTITVPAPPTTIDPAVAILEELGEFDFDLEPDQAQPPA